MINTMPRYTYECQKCEFIHQKRHPMNEVYQYCPNCLEEGNLLKIPPVASINSNSKARSDHRKDGDLVKEFIEESREELDKEKEFLSNKEYEI